MVLGKNVRLLYIFSDESRDRIPVFLSFNQTFSFIRLFVYSILFGRINTFHVANDLSTRKCDGSVEGTPGETRKKDRQAFQERKDARKEYFRFVSKSG